MLVIIYRLNNVFAKMACDEEEIGMSFLAEVLNYLAAFLSIHFRCYTNPSDHALFLLCLKSVNTNSFCSMPVCYITVRAAWLPLKTMA
jgi:hypothetical protein